MPSNIIRIFHVLLLSVNLILLSACHYGHSATNLINTPAKFAAERAWQRAYHSGQTQSAIVTLIDYSLPADQKRLWVIDMAHDHVLWQTYVSHGLNSGLLKTRYFSNQINSRSSSLGAYIAGPVYQGRHGSSVRLQGISPGLNDQAEARAIVLHGAWYVSPNFIHHYGRPGRSWGCPAVPMADIQRLIYYVSHQNLVYVYGSNHTVVNKKNHNKTFLISANKYNSEPEVLAMPVREYERQFSRRAPVGQLLRRRIHHQEWVALNNQEINFSEINQLKNLSWVHAELYAHSSKTRLCNAPIINNTQLATPAVKKTKQFIRWVGL